MKKAVVYNIENDDNLNLVNEPAALYFSSFNAIGYDKNNVLENLAINSTLLFNKILSVSGLTIKTLAENIFEITPKTLIKYKNNTTKIPSRIAELAIELNTLYLQGNVVFGSSMVFNEWLEKENSFFNNKKPSNFLNTSTGIHLIFEE